MNAPCVFLFQVRKLVTSVLWLFNFFRDAFMKIKCSLLFQLFDGIECEFPIFFIFMMIDGKSYTVNITMVVMLI